MKQLLGFLILTAVLFSCEKPQPPNENERIKMIESIFIGNTEIHIIKIDSIEYIVTYKGGIVKHK